MSVMKFVQETPRTLPEMYKYLSDEQKTGGQGMFGIGVNPEAPVPEMQFIQNLYHREGLAHPYAQVIMSFDAGTSLPLQEIEDICIQIGQILVGDERQVFGAIHSQGTKNIHCHYMINSVGIDGKLYQQGHHVNYFKRKANEVLREHGLNPIKVYTAPLPFEVRI